MKLSNTAVIAAATIAVAGIGAIVALAFALQDQSQLAPLATTILTGAGTLIAIVVTRESTEQTRRTVDDLANGTMDAKIRAAIADVIGEDRVAPQARRQVERDRAHLRSKNQQQH